MNRLAGIAAAATAALLLTGGSSAAWSIGGVGSGAVAAKVMPAVSAPSTVVASHDVTVTWTGAVFAGGGSVSGYVIKRYDGVTNALQSTLGGCTGTVSGLRCTEHAVPTGTWKYTVTPASGDNWLGSESSLSALAIVLI